MVGGVIQVIQNKNSKMKFLILLMVNKAISQLIDILSDYFPNLEVEKVPKDKLMPDREHFRMIKLKIF